MAGERTMPSENGQEDETTVLLIEGDPAIRETLRRELALAGFRVRWAPDGVTGLREALADPPDLVFLEVRLPSLDGQITLEQLRSHPAARGLPVVVYSHCPEAELVKHGFSPDALEYLVMNRPGMGSLLTAV
jgi:DNA-binding response OmpR family regulator